MNNDKTVQSASTDSATLAKPTITLLMPTMNEIEGLRIFVPQIDRSLFDEIVVMDGGSKDGSLEYAAEQGLTVVQQKRQGLAYGYYDLFRELKTDYVILFSPDGNCLVENLPQIVDKIHEGYDLVVVSRYLDDAKSYDDNHVTALGNWMFSVFINFLGRARVTDALTIYRATRRDIVEDENFERILYGPVFEPLVTSLWTIRKGKIIEIPGDEPARIGGESKMSVTYNGSCLLLMVIRLYLLRYLRLSV